MFEKYFAFAFNSFYFVLLKLDEINYNKQNSLVNDLLSIQMKFKEKKTNETNK